MPIQVNWDDGSTYESRRAANDKLAADYAASKKDKERGHRDAALKKVSVSLKGGRPDGRTMEGTGTALPDYTVLRPVLVVPAVPSPPADIADYSLTPIEASPPWEILPFGGAIAFLTPVLGSLVISMGRTMLVSMAIAGLAELGNELLMRPLQQYSKKARALNVRTHWATGNGGAVKGGEPIGPRQQPGAGEPGVWEGMKFGWDAIIEQWKDIGNFFDWLSPG